MITVLGAAAALLALSAAVIVTALHAVGTEVDPRVDGVSAYALTPFGLLYRLQVLATGTAALLLVLALVESNEASGVATLLLAAFGVARILIARYPTDPQGTTTFSRSGRRHVVLAAITFTTIAVAAPAISGSLAANADWEGPAPVLTTLGWATTIFALGTFASATTPPARRIFGWIERGAYAAMLAWLVVAAVGAAALGL